MTCNIEVNSHPFPASCPNITVTKLTKTPFRVDCKELRWWFIEPILGKTCHWATYDSPDWSLTSLTMCSVVRNAYIHDIPGVEINIVDKDMRNGAEASWLMYGTLQESAVRWLATVKQNPGEMRLRTFLDDDFDVDWGQQDRVIEDKGRFNSLADGIYNQNAAIQANGAGIYSVRIGVNDFECLRVLDVGNDCSEHGILIEAFINQDGRTVLWRRYNGNLWGKTENQKPWKEELPGNARLTVDGVTFVHWYDCLTDVALGR